jgi:hypothetical protein
MIRQERCERYVHLMQQLAQGSSGSRLSIFHLRITGFVDNHSGYFYRALKLSPFLFDDRNHRIDVDTTLLPLLLGTELLFTTESRKGGSTLMSCWLYALAVGSTVVLSYRRNASIHTYYAMRFRALGSPIAS